jgi:hypothetical protein
MAPRGGHGEKMSRHQERAITSLLVCGSVTAAAKRAGIGKRTLLRWLDEPTFAAAYKDARKKFADRSLAAVAAPLCQAGRKAVKALVKNLTAGSAATQNAAAVAILDRLFRFTEVLDVLPRLEEIEAERAAEKVGRNGWCNTPDGFGP